MHIGVLALTAGRTPARRYDPRERVASLLAKGLVERGLDVTLFATADSQTRAEEQGPTVV